MSIERTWFAADKTGFHILHTLFQTSLKYANVKRYDEWFTTGLLVEDGRCQGVTAIELRSGQVRAILGKAVILCTGGFGRVFPFTTNAAISTGDGLGIAFRAGVPLKDLEFVQYHPTGLPGTGILITEAARGEGGILLNKHGERYLQDYDLGEPLDVHDPRHPVLRSMELGPRDRLSQAFVKEEDRGNVFEGPHGTYVHLDIRHLGEKKINQKIPFVRELTKNYVGIDPVYEPIPVRPVVHYMMGGIDTGTMRPLRCPACTRRASAPASASTAPTGSAPIRWWRFLSSARCAGRNAAQWAREHPDLFRSRRSRSRLTTSRRVSPRTSSTSTTARSASPRSARSCSTRWRQAVASTAQTRACAKPSRSWRS